VSASNLRKSDFKIINNMQWLNSFAFDNKSRSSSRESGSKTCRGEFQSDFGSNFEEENGKNQKK